MASKDKPDVAKSDKDTQYDTNVETLQQMIEELPRGHNPEIRDHLNAAVQLMGGHPTR